MRDLFSQTEVYHILEEVGKGTFGVVVKCCRRGDGELVAIKMMKQNPQRNRVLKNERKLIDALCRSNVSNSHIVQFFEAFRDESHHYLVFELLEKSLFQLQRENGYKPMAVRNIRVITCQMLRALQKLKELAIIHADLKPENVMLVDHSRYPFRVKLIDFGSSSIFSEVRFIKEPYIQSRFYRSPEILLGLPFCEQVDMWSLGCVMAELYLGWPLYPGPSELEQVRYICETQGLPSQNLLNSASKTQRFFSWTKNSVGENQWQLKTNRSCSASGAEGHGGEQNKGGRGEDRRRYIFTSLDKLASLELMGHDTELRREDAAAEVVDRRSMVELLKRMLTLDSQHRILPIPALRDSFISMAQLSSVPEFSRYYKASALSMEQAGVWYKAPIRNPLSPRHHHLHHQHHQPARTNEHSKPFHFPRESEKAHQVCPQSPLASSQHEQSLQDSGQIASDSQCASGSPREMHALAELQKELSFVEEEMGLEASMGGCTQEDGCYNFQPSRVRVGTSNCNSDPSSTREDAFDCIFKPSSFTADTCVVESPSSLDCLLQLSNATSQSSTSLPLGHTTSTDCLFHLPHVTSTLDHQPVLRLQQYQRHPGDVSRLFPQAEHSFRGQPYGQGPQRYPLHSSYLSRMSKSQHLRYQPPAGCSRFDLYHYGLSQVPRGAKASEGLHPPLPSRFSTRQVQGPSTQDQPMSQPQLQPQFDTQPLTQHQPQNQSLPQTQSWTQPQTHSFPALARIQGPGSIDRMSPLTRRCLFHTVQRAAPATVGSGLSSPARLQTKRLPPSGGYSPRNQFQTTSSSPQLLQTSHKGAFLHYCSLRKGGKGTDGRLAQ